MGDDFLQKNRQYAEEITEAPKAQPSAEKRKKALQEGKADIRVKRSGMYQLLTFRVERKKTVCGEIPFLVLKRFLDLSELVRIADEYQLPVMAQNGKVYPRGKKESDFAGL